MQGPLLFLPAWKNFGITGETMENLKSKKLFLLDMDGTIYLDNNLFDGVIEFLDYIKRIGGRYLFLTNNSSKSVDKYVEKLKSLGINATSDDFLTSVNATERYIENKYKKIYENKKTKVGNRPVYNFVFGNVLGKKAVFLIQNIFPTTEKYIEEKYTNSNKDVEIPVVVQQEIIRTAFRVIRLAESGTNIPFYNIIEMKKILLEGKNA